MLIVWIKLDLIYGKKDQINNNIMGDNTFSGFYKLSIQKRREILQNSSKNKISINNAKNDIKPDNYNPTCNLSKDFLQDSDSWNKTSLTLNIADTMVENCIGLLSMPLGIAPTFVVNGVSRIVPMATEEPSVIAAASAAAKTICKYPYGFSATVDDRAIVYAQIQIKDIKEHTDIETSQKNLESAKKIIDSNSNTIIELANTFCKSMVKRGGGCVGIKTRLIKSSSYKANYEGIYVKTRKLVFKDEISKNTVSNEIEINSRDDVNKNKSIGWLIVHLRLDVCDSMGANCASTVGEGVTPLIDSLIEHLGLKVGIRIVSNYCIERKATSYFRIPTRLLDYKGIPGKLVSERIIEANEWAKSDIFRAVTHNKGIMNGIDAVAVATGQDWRAIEASFHLHAAVLGKYNKMNEIDSNVETSTEWEERYEYQSLTDYKIEKFKSNDKQDDEEYLVGILDIPLAAGIRGGAVSTGEEYQRNLSIMGSPTSKELCEIIASVGLAQNFAALRALVTEGIQSGHMRLHQRRLEHNNMN